MMCADFSCLKEEMEALERADIDIYHTDIMDGSFVPNISLGINDLKAFRKLTERPVDVHLMIEKPSEKVDWFIDAGADLVYIHPEAERYVLKTLAHIRSRGKKAGIAVNPDTSVDTVAELLELCDYVLVMTVNPGFAGQPYLPFIRRKIERLAELKQHYTYRIIVDGACSPAVIEELGNCGADGFVLGSSSLFGKEGTYEETVRKLRTI